LVPQTKRPRLRALEAFEAVARHHSMSRAAAELGVTQSAVSHQMRQLTEVIGERLFAVQGRGITLTPAGELLSDRIRAAFGSIDRSIAEVTGTNRRLLRLAICSSFAPGWLIPRLPDFYAAHPNVRLQLHMYAQDPELTDKVADAFVTTLPKEAGFWSLFLHSERLVPVYAASREPFRLGDLPLITTTLDPPDIGDDWIGFCAANDRCLDDLHTGDWLQVSHYVLAYDMAKRGIGVAIVPDFLAAADLAAGTMRRLPGVGLATREDYYLCVKTSRRDEPELQALAIWLQRQVSGSGS